MHRFLGEAAAFYMTLVDGSDATFGGAQGVGIDLDQGDVEAAVDERDGYAGAHGAAADHAGVFERPRFGDAAFDFGRARGDAVGVEKVP